MTIVEYQAFQLLEFHFHAKKLETKHASTPPSPSPSPKKKTKKKQNLNPVCPKPPKTRTLSKTFTQLLTAVTS